MKLPGLGERADAVLVLERDIHTGDLRLLLGETREEGVGPVVTADDDVPRLGEHPGQRVDPEHLTIEERDPHAPPVFRRHHRPPDPWEPQQRVVGSEVSRVGPKVNRR